ncbi:hypothetical protein Dsin_008006 [Dipteronia sinensis]|uniref:Uncharacterized protein n=1 Tax=Dipteronia sinensis TaxID=43782 RepID=A0AAE0EHD8_9ROSI|nr:hypothetical protein Dsin_008006 [Dipteronia sinensis]
MVRLKPPLMDWIPRPMGNFDIPMWEVGSGVVAYTRTTEVDSASDIQPVVELEPLSVMREDYQLENKVVEFEADSARENEELEDEDEEDEEMDEEYKENEKSAFKKSSNASSSHVFGNSMPAFRVSSSSFGGGPFPADVIGFNVDDAREEEELDDEDGEEKELEDEDGEEEELDEKDKEDEKTAFNKPFYDDKSFEELRCKYYQLGDKCGPLPADVIGFSANEEDKEMNQNLCRVAAYTPTTEPDNDSDT